MTASEMIDCIETKIKLFYARPNASNTKASKEQQRRIRKILAGKDIIVKCPKETVYIGTADDKTHREAGAETSYSGRRFQSSHQSIHQVKKKRCTSSETPRNAHYLFDRVTRTKVALAETAVLKANRVMDKPTGAEFDVEHNIGRIPYQTVATPDKKSHKIQEENPSRKKLFPIVKDGVIPKHYQDIIKAEAERRGDDFVLTPKGATPPMQRYNTSLCRRRYQSTASIINDGIHDDTVTTSVIEWN